MRLDDPRDLRRVPAHLKRDPILQAQAPREQLKRRRRRLDPPHRSRLASLVNRDLAKIAMNIQPDRFHHNTSTHVNERNGRAAGKRHRPIRAQGTTG